MNMHLAIIINFLKLWETEAVSETKHCKAAKHSTECGWGSLSKCDFHLPPQFHKLCMHNVANDGSLDIDNKHVHFYFNETIAVSFNAGVQMKYTTSPTINCAYNLCHQEWFNFFCFSILINLLNLHKRNALNGECTCTIEVQHTSPTNFSIKSWISIMAQQRIVCNRAFQHDWGYLERHLYECLFKWLMEKRFHHSLSSYFLYPRFYRNNWSGWCVVSLEQLHWWTV